MSFRSFLTKECSRNRTLFVACGVGFVSYSAWHLWRGNWGVASFLGGLGLVSLAAGALLSERHLSTLANALILVNIFAAIAALAVGARVQ